MNTTMDKLAVGALFRFGHDSPDRPLKFIKISNRYSKCTVDDETRPNFDDDVTDDEAANEPVTYFGRSETV